MKKPEVLAPVRNMATLEYAIGNGADAVYFGISDFNARNNIENFTIDNVKSAIDFAHLFGVKVYLTLNILFHDSEFEKVDEILTKTSAYGVDAYIIQDIGLLYYIKQKFPSLEVHASTQMGFENLEGVRFAKEEGFKRVVLSRETNLGDIKKIHDNVDIDIEYFVQGALCVAFSGNCYLCSLLAGASGNRGVCKQFCRLNYTLQNEKEKKSGYLLSTKDFCMLPYLKKLYENGVCSFKIEGRARREGYIASAVSVYKNAVENNFNYSDDDVITLKKAFNRGDFTPGYFENGQILYSKAQNHIGVEIGYVKRVNNGKRFNEIDIVSKHLLVKDDVIKFFVDESEDGVVTIKDIKVIGDNVYRITTTNKINPKAKVRLIVDNALEQEYLSKKRKIFVDAKFIGNVGQKAKLIFKSQMAECEVESDEVLQEAKNFALTKEECFAQVGKLGDEFELKNFEFVSKNIFIAKSVLNNLRRNALEKLKENILKNYEKIEFLAKKSQKIDKNIEIFDEKQEKINIISFDNFEKLSQKDFENDIFIFAPNDFEKENILADYEKYKHLNVFISLPVIASQQEVEKLKDILSYCENWGVVANNYYALKLKPKDKTIIGTGMNVFNSYSVKFYVEKGYKMIIASNELGEDISNCGAMIAYYNEYYPEYMHFNHCPMKEHFDSKCDKCVFKNGFVYLLGSKTFNLVRKRICKCQFVLKSKEKEIRLLSEKYAKIKEIV